MSYTYGKSGERTGISYPGGRTVSYEYDSLLRLSGLNNGSGDAAMYTYNGLGHRTGRETNRGREDYIIDLTRPYHNMLIMIDAEKSRTFYWDGNVSAMSEITTYKITSIFHYYLQNELGSPLRVSGCNTDTEGKEDGYLSYGYDEFGNDLYESLYNDMEDVGIPNPYSRQGEEQPFSYTGYPYDDISGIYFKLVDLNGLIPENSIFII